MGRKNSRRARHCRTRVTACGGEADEVRMSDTMDETTPITTIWVYSWCIILRVHQPLHGMGDLELTSASSRPCLLVSLFIASASSSAYNRMASWERYHTLCRRCYVHESTVTRVRHLWRARESGRFLYFLIAYVSTDEQICS